MTVFCWPSQLLISEGESGRGKAFITDKLLATPVIKQRSLKKRNSWQRLASNMRAHIFAESCRQRQTDKHQTLVTKYQKRDYNASLIFCNIVWTGNKHEPLFCG
jgi:hypothetical protein